MDSLSETIDNEQMLVKNEKNETIDHLARYYFASTIIPDKKVKILDCASGAGYGSYLIAKTKKNAYVTGLEIDQDVYDYSKKKFRLKNLKFVREDIYKTKLKKGSFDYIISFETIEHVNDQQGLIKIFHDLLKPGGTLIISTPNRRLVSPGLKKPLNTYHLREYLADEYGSHLREEFKKVELLFQAHTVQGSIIQVRDKVSLFLSPLGDSAVKVFLNSLRKVNTKLNKKEFVEISPKNLEPLFKESLIYSKSFPNKMDENKLLEYVSMTAVCKKR